MVAKFQNKTREEIETMLGLGDLRQTRFYQDAKMDAKLEAIPRIIKSGVSVEQIAQWLDLPLEVVREVAEKSQ